jgi:hypothetical protein
MCDEAEQVVDHAQRPYPERLGDGRFLAVGQTPGGRYLQVAYI